ncbi:NAD(P)/FAD-dependent oxidoreductase [Dyadobacter sp. Leaf189]|uniref:NAD(P)/FAD-dependent oxidoreductase n=1 Tax=Dyadobacter sp. Leaf189 TaxID=1736295 RepID=UPI000700DB4F|nr:NAD(P)/FAD-dependent oxidoreductase [Dyadobacter sp. Leaf189]KQS27695.1 oxidoreductase [Dyadobacter sp. Leaf189]
MEMQTEQYECAIIGGGLSGLCLAIQLAGQERSVIVFEKGRYPFHKVCGEYISMESYGFLHTLGFPFEKAGIPMISKLGISSESGFMLNQNLKSGGFGISRFLLDHELSLRARQLGVVIMEECRVNDVKQEGKAYFLQTTQGTFMAKVVCGSYGKYAPQYINEPKSGGDNNYIGVKYHIKTDFPADRIELHNFKDGYCGISKVEGDKYCLCYLTTSRNLQENGKDIRQMEEHVLFKNPFLRKYFLNSEFLYKQPLVISNVHFQKKQTVLNGVLLLGDAAGTITPLCGNGMSMGMRASKLLAVEIVRYLQNQQSAAELAANYKREWDRAFKNRITAGYYLQNLFGKKVTTDLALRFLHNAPALTDKLIGLTHGPAF